MITALLATLLLFVSPSELQNTSPEQLFDFWVGEWNLTWQDAEGNTRHGYNEVVKILGERVIQENFKVITTSADSTTFRGMSLSVYNPRTEQWHQAWADSQGGYYNFVGEFEGDKRMFTTTVTNPRGKEVRLRMVFRDITEDTFTWDWESSTDEGETWKLNWQINYQRKK